VLLEPRPGNPGNRFGNSNGFGVVEVVGSSPDAKTEPFVLVTNCGSTTAPPTGGGWLGSVEGIALLDDFKSQQLPK